jgi:hypothetical protein
MTRKFDDATIERWKTLADKRLATLGHTRADVKTGRDAWAFAHMCGITNEAYKDRSVTDAHIKTALARVFPNAIFSDKYRY